MLNEWNYLPLKQSTNSSLSEPARFSTWNTLLAFGIGQSFIPPSCPTHCPCPFTTCSCDPFPNTLPPEQWVAQPQDWEPPIQVHWATDVEQAQKCKGKLRNDPGRDFFGGPVAKTLSSQFRSLGLIPGQGTRPHMPQLRVLMSKLKRSRMPQQR